MTDIRFPHVQLCMGPLIQHQHCAHFRKSEDQLDINYVLLHSSTLFIYLLAIMHTNIELNE